MDKQTIIVTGGTGGLGHAVVPALLDAGYRVVVTYHVPSEWASLQQQLGAAAIEGMEVNLLDEVAVQGAVAAMQGPIYGLVNLAGGFAMASVVETTQELWRQQLDMNLTTALIMCRAVVPQMQQQGAGRIVNVSSAAVRQASANLVAYTVAKRGILALTETLAQELKNTAITVNAIMPGSLDTPANRAFVPERERLPLDRVASVITFLLSEGASGVTAAAIPITVTGK